VTPLPPPVGHVLPSASPLGIVQWFAAGLVVFGGLLLLLLRTSWLRWLGWTALAVGIAGSVAVEAGAVAPSPPAQSLSLAQPVGGAPVTSPLLVTVCGRLASGSRAHLPAAGDVLSVFLDGRQVLTTSGASGAVIASIGVHTVRAEILTSDHREFQPPLLTERQVVVSGTGPLPAAAACPR
jgi:hypothetical protein